MVATADGSIQHPPIIIPNERAGDHNERKMLLLNIKKENSKRIWWKWWNGKMENNNKMNIIIFLPITLSIFPIIVIQFEF